MITSSRKFLDVQKIIIGKQRKWSKLKAAKKERKYNKREKKKKTGYFSPLKTRSKFLVFLMLPDRHLNKAGGFNSQKL